MPDRLGSREPDEGAAVVEGEPTDVEALVRLARHFRELGQNERAFRLADQARKLRHAEPRLPVSEHDRGWLQEISITAYYVGQRELGLDACEKLLSLRDEPANPFDSQLTAQNELFYLPTAVRVRRAGTIPISRALATKAEPFWGLARENTTEYVPKNPALVRTGERVFLNVCLVNYAHERGRVFVSNDPDGVIRTRSAVLEWDADAATVKSERESAIELPDGWPIAPIIRGLEDQRWVAHAGGVWLTATTYHVTGRQGEPRVVLGRMCDDLSGVARLIRLSYEREQPCEKNWLPWSVDGELFLIYSYDPFVVLRADTETGVCVEAVRWTPPWSARRWRGGAPPVPHPERPERFVMLVHETVRREHDTVYLHRFVELSARLDASGERALRLERYGRLFSFDHHGVEYACGLLDRGNGALLVTFGSEEREARFAELAWSDVEAFLSSSYS
jgi:hypothetical protein